MLKVFFFFSSDALHSTQDLSSLTRDQTLPCPGPNPPSNRSGSTESQPLTAWEIPTTDIYYLTVSVGQKFWESIAAFSASGSHKVVKVLAGWYSHLETHLGKKNSGSRLIQFVGRIHFFIAL